MKKGVIFSCSFFVVTSLAICCSCKKKSTKPEVAPGKQHALVGLSMLTFRGSSPGLAGITASIDHVTAKGVNLFGMAPEWSELEPAPHIFSFRDPITNPLTLTDPNNDKFKSFILVLKMIDSNRKILPMDLTNHTFDDPSVVVRFHNLLDTISKIPSITRVSHILIGNEVDGYLASHPDELNAFAVFFDAAVSHIHARMPWVKVGTVITFNAAVRQPVMFNRLARVADYITYTYYPTENTNPNWQMRPPSDVFGDIAMMAALAGTKPFAFTEIGYPSAADNHSSPLLQQQFVNNVFNALRVYKANGRLAFLFYHGLYDYPPGFCAQYAKSQAIAADHLCNFMNSLGLNDFTTGQPKPAWSAFTTQLQDW